MRTLSLAVVLGAGVACTPAVTTTTTTEPAPIVAATSPSAAVTPVMLPPGVQWSPAPAALPPGARVAVIDGDPSKEGIFTMRLWMPNDYRLLPHTHPAYEHLTVISGVLHLGMGNTFTMSGAEELRQGAFLVVAPNMAHFVHAAGEDRAVESQVRQPGGRSADPLDEP